jgi:hypothetical protein
MPTSEEIAMYRKIRLWRSMSAASLVGVAALSGSKPADASVEIPPETGLSQGAAQGTGSAPAIAPPEAMEREGEGEGADKTVDMATDDVAYLTHLGLMRGHLRVGYELFRAGHPEHAVMHMKHPKSELYTDIVPALQARGSRGFADELEALAAAVESKAPLSEVEAAYQSVVTAIDASEAVVPAANRLGAGPGLQRVVNLTRTAAVEYAIGVVGGKLVNAHEYQDAYGFTRIAAQVAEDIDVSGNVAQAEAVNNVKTLLAELDVA